MNAAQPADDRVSWMLLERARHNPFVVTRPGLTSLS